MMVRDLNKSRLLPTAVAVLSGVCIALIVLLFIRAEDAERRDARIDQLESEFKKAGLDVPPPPGTSPTTPPVIVSAWWFGTQRPQGGAGAPGSTVVVSPSTTQAPTTTTTTTTTAPPRTCVLVVCVGGR